MKIRFSKTRLLAMCVKEFYQIVRDPSSIVIAFILPAILLLIFGFGINLDSTTVKIGVVMEDNSVAANKFLSTLINNPSFIVVVSDKRKEIEELLDRSKIRGAIIIPENFGKNLLTNINQPLLQMIGDGGDPNTTVFVKGAINGLWASWLQKEYQYLPNNSKNIQIEERYWYNPTAKSRNFLVPGSIAIILTVIGTLLTSLVVAREWEKGTMESLLSTPITNVEFLLSKLIPYYFLGIVSLISCLFISFYIMNIPFQGSFFLLFVSTTLFLAPSLGIGLFLSTAIRNQFDAAQAALTFAFLPAVMLSGFIFEIQSMPLFLQAITYLFPATYYVNLLQNIFQAGTIGTIILKNYFGLLLLSVFWLYLTFAKTSSNLE